MASVFGPNVTCYAADKFMDGVVRGCLAKLEKIEKPNTESRAKLSRLNPDLVVFHVGLPHDLV